MKRLKIENAKNFSDFIDIIQRENNCGYRCHYDLINENMKEGYVYKELGTYWGHSAAIGVLAGAKELHVVDIDTEPFNVHKKYFEEELGSGKLKVYQCSSHDWRCISPCDALLVDSLHKWPHVVKELELHSGTVKDWIIFHDTYKVHGQPSPLGPGIKMWLMTPQGQHFELIEELTDGVGAILIRRKHL
jgi:hypothetical protein